MQTLFYPDFGALEISEKPAPICGAADVVVRVAACGVCGSELETFRARSDRRSPPLIMGHEFCGEVVEAGRDVDSVSAGDSVIANAIVHCGTCHFCEAGQTHLCSAREIFGMHRPGAFAEYVAVPERVLAAWPPAVAAESACLTEPLANGVHVANLLRNSPTELAVVIGAGPIGLSVLQALRALLGSTVICFDLDTRRARLAESLGATAAFDDADELRQWVRDATDGGVDLVVDAVGIGVTKRLALECARVGGTCVWLGLGQDAAEIPTYQLTLGERSILGSYGATMEELRVAIDLMANRQVDMLSWTTAYPLKEGVEAFLRMANAAGDDVKVVLRPGGLS